MGLFDSITNLISGGAEGGYGDMQAEIEKAIQALQGNYDQGRAAYQPWATAGTNALANLNQYYGKMADPQAYYKQVMSGWNMSPAAQMQAQYGQKAMNQSAAAGGTVGTPAQQEGVARFMQNLVSGDQQQYLDNVMGIGNNYAAGEGNIMNTGYNAAGNIANSYFNQGNSIAGLYGNMGQAQLQQDMARGGAINDLLGGAYSFANSKGWLPQWASAG